MIWFSTKVRLVCLIEPDGSDGGMDSVHLFRAEDYDDARAKALQIGHSHEQEYKNHQGMLVRWRFQEIVSLDAIKAENLDGAEVYSEPIEFEEGEGIPFDTVFHPEDSEPTTTL